MTAERSTPCAAVLGAPGLSAGPSRAVRRPPGGPGETRVVLATPDPVFAALCQQALDGSGLQLVASVGTAELVDTARRLAPELIVLDADGQDVAAIKVLATKVMLVSDARIALVSAYLAPGAPGLCALLTSLAVSFVQKARGASWLGLPRDDRASFVAALRAAAASDHGEITAGADLDAGWNAGAEPPPTPARSRP